MNRVALLFPVLIALLALPARAERVAQVEIPDVLEGRGASLVLNGAGVRTRFFVAVYVGGLYLLRRSADAAAIVAADEPMAIKLVMVSGLVTNERMRKSIEAGFERSTHGNTAPFRDAIDTLMGVYDDALEEADEFDLVYTPGDGVRVYKNGGHRATIRGGLAFKRALFGIWLSDRPVQKSLKRDMLGL